MIHLKHVMTVRSMGMLLIVLALAGSTAACGSTTTAASTVSSLSIAGAVPSVGSSSQLTATAKLKRRGVLSGYADVIDALYLT